MPVTITVASAQHPADPTDPGDADDPGSLSGSAMSTRGFGSTGSSKTAGREDPACRVTLLEAGPDVASDTPDDIRDGWRPPRAFDWGHVSEPDQSGVTRDLPRGRLLGGCSSTNATFALRGHPADYDGWADAGLAGWTFEDTMADGDPLAVVDETGRVRGTTGLCIVDASVMPRPPSANTHVPTVMVAEHLATRLVDDVS